jgi:hypothetical protein
MDYNPYAPSAASVMAPEKRAIWTKELKSARTLLILVGVIQLLFGAYAFYTVRDQFDEAVRAQVAQQGPGYEVDQKAADQAFDDNKALVYGLTAVPVGLGVLFLILSVFVFRFPIGVTLTGLIVFVLAHLGDALVDPSSLLKGIILKVVFITGLWKAYQSARTATALEKERTVH